nr:calcineurin B-like protein 4 [Tanacetum cinerariifolium]
MLAPSGGSLILYQAYGNLYAITGKNAYLLEDKRIPSVGKHCVLSSEDLAFCLQKILRFVSEDLVFCLQKILHFVFKDLAFASEALRFVFKDLAFCLRSTAFSGLRDRPPMLATGRYPHWQSRFLQYIDTRPNGDALKKCILSVPTRTLNASECVARGCALCCAMLSPTLQVRDYEVQDVFPYSIGLPLDEGENEQPRYCTFFGKGSSFPGHHHSTFTASIPCEFQVYYTNTTDLPAGLSPEVGLFSMDFSQSSGAEQAMSSKPSSPKHDVPVESKQRKPPVESDQKGHPVDSDEKDNPVHSNEKDNPVDSNEKDNPVDSDQKDRPMDSKKRNHSVDMDQRDHPMDLKQRDHPVDSDKKECPMDSKKRKHPVDMDQRNNLMDSKLRDHLVDSEQKDRPIDSKKRNHSDFITWMKFEGNTRDLSSFGEETNKIIDLHQINEEVLFIERRDEVAGIKRRRRDLSSDGVRDPATPSGRDRLKEDLESSTLEPNLTYHHQMSCSASDGVLKRKRTYFLSRSGNFFGMAQWNESIKSVIDFILQKHTWELVGLLLGCKLLVYKWISKKKMKADGTIDKYKARLVIKGFRQHEGLDFFDTYFPVTRTTSIRMVLAIVALRKLKVHQMDMKMTFLNGDLGNVLYTNQSDGFMAPGLESKVCRLVKSLYDSMKALKQGF